MSVVLPAPSGPTSPVTCPGLIVCVMLSSAAGPCAAKRLLRPRIVTSGSLMLSIGNARGSGVEHRDGNRHALAQDGTGIVDDDPNAIHEGGAELARLHSLRGKLGGRGDETDLAFEHRRPGRVGSDTHLHARLNAAEIDLREVAANPHGVGQAQYKHRLAGSDNGANLAHAR